MKTKNQTGHTVPALAIAKAANEDGFAVTGARDAQRSKPSWSPLEVWRTRVKDNGQLKQNEPA